MRELVELRRDDYEDSEKDTDLETEPGQGGCFFEDEKKNVDLECQLYPKQNEGKAF